MSRKPKSKARRKSKIYTNGELNKIIDSLIHPLAKADARYMALDSILHGMVEQDPSTTIRKFIRYNLPKILEQIEKSSKTDLKEE